METMGTTLAMKDIKGLNSTFFLCKIISEKKAKNLTCESDVSHFNRLFTDLLFCNFLLVKQIFTLSEHHKTKTLFNC